MAAYVFGELAETLKIGEALDAGMIGINRGLVSDPEAPFGGVKQSGIGREGARAGLDEYLDGLAPVADQRPNPTRATPL